MIVYLDQNKWIQFAKVILGKEHCEEIARLAALSDTNRLQFPLSAMHFMETARIANPGRRERLGMVMWRISRGQTIAAIRSIVTFEIERALSKTFPQVQVGAFQFLGRGVEHAFGVRYGFNFPAGIQDLVERAVLTGESVMGKRPPPFVGLSPRQDFKVHLSKLQSIKAELPPEKWEDALYGLSLGDIIDPFTRVLLKYGIANTALELMGLSGTKTLLDSMPSRKVDIHLHKQVLKNKHYNPKLTDLEDWAGLGIGAAYCDVMVCEKHFRDLLYRDGFTPKAIVLDDLTELLSLAEARMDT